MRKEIKAIMAERGLDNKFSVNEVSFSDLARKSRYVVTIKDWTPSQPVSELKNAIRERFPGVIVMFDGPGIVESSW